MYHRFNNHYNSYLPNRKCLYFEGFVYSERREFVVCRASPADIKFNELTPRRTQQQETERAGTTNHRKTEYFNSSRLVAAGTCMFWDSVVVYPPPPPAHFPLHFSSLTEVEAIRYSECGFEVIGLRAPARTTQTLPERS